VVARNTVRPVRLHQLLRSQDLSLTGSDVGARGPGGLADLLELARAESLCDQRDLLWRDAEPVQRVPGQLDRELLFAEHHLVRTGLSQNIGRVARVRAGDDADPLVRPPGDLNDTP